MNYDRLLEEFDELCESKKRLRIILNQTPKEKLADLLKTTINSLEETISDFGKALDELEKEKKDEE